jgi:hypothetical protein
MMVDLPRNNVDRGFEIRRRLCRLPDPKFLLSPVYFVRLTSVVPSHCRLARLSSSPPWLLPVTTSSLSDLRRWPGDAPDPLPCGCARPRCSSWPPSPAQPPSPFLLLLLPPASNVSASPQQSFAPPPLALHPPLGRVPPLPGKNASDRNPGQRRRQSRLEMGVEQQPSPRQCCPSFPPPAAPSTAS